MFHADRWAGAFMAVTGENSDSAFLCLKALSVSVRSLRGVFFGHSASAKLEKILRESAEASGEKEASPPVEYAIRFACLLVEKNCFRYINVLLQRIEHKLDENKGILDLTVESASPLESAYEEELAQMIKGKTGATNVKMKTSVKPELLGGYILRIGGFYVDASLKGQLENMKEMLMKGGGNGEL